MNNILVDNLNFKKSKNVPIWLMRQAGRYMKEYHVIKNKFSSFMEMCKNEQALVEITLQPIKKFDFDAAIIFSDILLILDAIDIKVEFVPGKGPVIENFKNSNVIRNLPKSLNMEKVLPCYKAIKRVKKELSNKALIGFAAAPWTLATYYVEGSITKDLSKIKEFSYKQSDDMDYLINLFSDLISEHLINQVEAGVDALQIFDTHSYKMDFRMHEKYSIEQLKKISKNIRKKYPNIPIIYYTKSSRLRHYNLEQYINCLSLNSNVSIIEEKKDIKKTLCYQGNLDPLLLVAGGNKMIEETNKILEEMKDSFFVFNLGHGVLPQTPIQNVYKLVETVKKFKN